MSKVVLTFVERFAATGISASAEDTPDKQKPAGRPKQASPTPSQSGGVGTLVQHGAHASNGPHGGQAANSMLPQEPVPESKSGR
jgi:hypothetical protein